MRSMAKEKFELLRNEGLKHIITIRNDNDHTMRMLFNVDECELIMLDGITQKLRKKHETIIADIAYRKGHAYLMWVQSTENMRQRIC